MFLSKLNNTKVHLKNIIKNTANTLASLVKVSLLSKRKNKIPHSEKKDCIILGNGPSLRESILKNPDFFNEKELFCVNNFASAEYFVKLKPRNYIIKDPIFWSNAIDQGSLNAIEDLKNNAYWPIRFFLPYEAKSSKILNSLPKENSNIQLIYYNHTVFKGFKTISHFFYKNGWAMPQSQNVLVASLYLALNMKFKEIYLAGADHNYLESLIVNDDNIICYKEFHFYTEKPAEMNYRIFYKNLETKEVFSMKEILITFSKVFAGYENIKQYADFMQSKIYNISETSFIDSFERKKIK